MRLNPAYNDRRRAIAFLAVTFGLGFLVFWVTAALFITLAVLVGGSFSAHAFSQISEFWADSIQSPVFILKTYFSWFSDYIFNEPRHTTWASFFKWKIPLIPMMAYVLFCGFMIGYNPYDYRPQYFRSGREARSDDIRKMGLFKGKYLYIGNFKKKPMRLTETRSAFCIGAPLSGKTAGVVIPNILTADNACLFIHDPKGELAAATSGYRSTKGPTFIMDFSKVDVPEQDVYYPCWNPLNEENMPPQHKGRDSYIDGLVNFLIPDGPEGTDPYWVKAGRSCLTGLTIYITNKVAQAQANDYFLNRLRQKSIDAADLDVLLSYYQGMQQTPEVKSAVLAVKERKLSLQNYVPIGTWDPLPHNWVGREASFGMLLDLLNNWMFSKTIELRKRRDQGDIMAMSLDVWQTIFDTIVDETFYYGYSRRALLELNQVLSLPDKQRASVISMAQTGIELFKNSAIRSRTSSNDFTYKDLRGIKNPQTGEYEPVTFYINNEGGAVCNLFINMVTGYLMSKGPLQADMGPYPVEFILDDFARMPSLQSISDGITFGRSKANIFLVVVQDWHQITAKYGENTTDIIMNSIGAKIIKRQNNPDTRNKVMEGIMKLTRKVEGSHGGAVGFGKDVNPFYQKGGYKYIEDSTIGGTGILNMTMDKQLVLVTGWYHRPIQAATPLYFNNEQMKQKASLPKASPVPAFVQARKMKEHRRALDIQLDVLT